MHSSYFTYLNQTINEGLTMCQLTAHSVVNYPLRKNKFVAYWNDLIITPNCKIQIKLKPTNENELGTKQLIT